RRVMTPQATSLWVNENGYMLRDTMSDLVHELPENGSTLSAERQGLSVAWEFAVHAIVGMVIFSIIAIPAVGLDLILHKLRNYGTSTFITLGLELAAYVLFAADLLLFMVFVFRTARRTSKRL